MDWRKKVVFSASLKPMSVNRFNCKLTLKKDYVRIKPYPENEAYILFENKYISAKISKSTGMLCEYILNGEKLISDMGINVYKDDADPWGMNVSQFSELVGKFDLAEPPCVIENGDVRTKISSVLNYNSSKAVVTYTFKKLSKEIDIDIKTITIDENIMIKLVIDTTLKKDAVGYAQTMFGTEKTLKDSKEIVFQKWCGLNDGHHSLDVLNSGTYGGSFNDSSIGISLLRTPVYSAHPVDDVELAPNDRPYNHLDTGERHFKFRIIADEKFTDEKSEIFNMAPYVLSFFPSGKGKKINNGCFIQNKSIILSAYKNEERGKLIRLFNSKCNTEATKITMDNQEFETELEPFEVKTFIKSGDKLIKTDMLGGIIND